MNVAFNVLTLRLAYNNAGGRRGVYMYRRIPGTNITKMLAAGRGWWRDSVRRIFRWISVTTFLILIKVRKLLFPADPSSDLSDGH